MNELIVMSLFFFFFLPERKRITLRNSCKWVDPWGSECALHVEWWCWGHSSLEPIFKIRSVWHQRPLVSRRPDNTIFFFPDNIIWGLCLGSWSLGFRPFTREQRPKMTDTLGWSREELVVSTVSGKSSLWVTGWWKFFILRISAWRANPELGHLGMFLFWSCFHCVWRYGESGGGEGIRKNNKAKLNPGIKMEPKSF